MTRAELASLLGESLTVRLESGRFWCVTPPGVMVRQLAEAVAEDIYEEVCGAGRDKS